MASVQTEQHGLQAHTDGAWDYKTPVQTRSERFKATDVNEFPEVTGREPNWKFVPLTKISALLNDPLDGGEHPVEVTDAPGVTTEWVATGEGVQGRIGIPEDRASANAWGAAERVLQITVDGEDPKTVIVERSKLTQHPSAAHTVIEAKPHSQGLVIIENSGDAHLAENVEILVGDGAKLSVVTIQEWNDGAVHLASHFATVGRDANLTHIVVSLGGDVVRVNPTIHLDHDGANGEAYGAYFADAGQHIEQQVFMDHDAEHTRSRVLYKGALQGEGARTVWIGDVLIRRNATGTDTYEANRNLVLSEGTRADSIPNLEIETGDIAGGGHASTTGRFDEEHLFYLRSRGIPENEAKKLVVRGFLLEVLQQIGDATVEARLQEAIESELEQSVFA